MRIPILCAIALALSHAASAATLAIVSDKATYLPGETITLSIFGDAQGASAYGVFGRLEMSGAALDFVSASQVPLAPGWVKGSLESSDDGVLLTVEAFDQIAPFGMLIIFGILFVPQLNAIFFGVVFGISDLLGIPESLIDDGLRTLQFWR